MATKPLGPPAWWTVAETCRVLKVSKQTVIRMCRADLLRWVRVGTGTKQITRRIDPASVRAHQEAAGA